MSKHPLDDLDLDLLFPDGVDPALWRELPDPDEEDGTAEGDDEDVPCPPYVRALLGYDPDELFPDG